MNRIKALLAVILPATFLAISAPAERLDALERMQPTLDAFGGQPQLAERFAATARARR